MPDDQEAAANRIKTLSTMRIALGDARGRLRKPLSWSERRAERKAWKRLRKDLERAGKAWFALDRAEKEYRSAVERSEVFGAQMLNSPPNDPTNVPREMNRLTSQFMAKADVSHKKLRAAQEADDQAARAWDAWSAIVGQESAEAALRAAGLEV